MQVGDLSNIIIIIILILNLLLFAVGDSALLGF